MSGPIAQFQIGKQGLTQGVIEALNSVFKNHKHVRVSVLRASGRDRTTIDAMAESLVSQLEVACDYRVIGFTIVLRKRSSVKK